MNKFKRVLNCEAAAVERVLQSMFFRQIITNHADPLGEEQIQKYTMNCVGCLFLYIVGLLAIGG